MKVIAIDGSGVRGGTVTTAVGAAAQAIEAAGGEVVYARLYDGGGPLSAGAAGRTSEDARLEALVSTLLDSDGLLLGTPALSRGMNAATRRLLRRLDHAFAGDPLSRGYRGRPLRFSPGRRVGLITASPVPGPLANAYAASLGPAPHVRRTFSRAGVRVLRHVTIADMPGHPLARDKAVAKATDLGRELADEVLSSGRYVPVRWAEPTLARVRSAS